MSPGIDLDEPTATSPSEFHYSTTLLESVKEWNAWRKVNQNRKLAIQKLNLSKKDLRCANFANIKIIDVDFSDCQLDEADFSGAIVNGCRFDRTQLVDTKFEEAKCTRSIFSGASLTRCTLNGATFANCDFSRCHGTGLRAKPVSSKERINNPLTIFSANKPPELTKCHFDGSILRDFEFEGVCKKSRFCAADLESCNLKSSKFIGCDFSTANLMGAHLDHCQLISCNFRGAILKNTHFQGSALNESDLRGARLDLKTEFAGTKFHQVSIDSTDLVEAFGTRLQDKISAEQIAGLFIGSDFIRLKRDFTGFKRWLHLGALLIFVAPYILYLVRVEFGHEAVKQVRQLETQAQLNVDNAIDAQAIETDQYIANHFPKLGTESLTNEIAKAADAAKKKVSKFFKDDNQAPPKPVVRLLFEYIKHHDGGSNPDYLDLASYYFFYFLLSYNLLRLAILYKTSVLEHEQQVVNLAANFYFKEHPNWAALYHFMRAVTIPYYILVVLHTWEYARSARYSFS